MATKINWHISHTLPFNGPLSGTTQVSQYQKGKTSLDFTEARDSEWQWHQLGHMQVCTLLQTDNHASTPPLIFYGPDALSAAQPTVSKHCRHGISQNISEYFFNIGWESDGISHLKLHDDLHWCHLAGGTFGVSAPKSDKQATSVIRI